MAEEDTKEVLKRCETLKTKFAEFEEIHGKFHNGLTIDDEIDESDTYFDDVQRKYITSIKTIRKWLAEQDQKTKPQAQTHVASSDIVSRAELLGLINLPKLELETFTGDPLCFHSFFAAFDEHVDHTTTDPSVKLTRLLQSTSGKAKDAIRYCSLVGGDQGYHEAREILKRRFGNDHLIAERIIKDLKHGKPVKNPDDLQRLADDISDSFATLSRLKKLHEVDTQSSILEISSRLQPYIQNRWKRHALEQKRERDTYPGFPEFVKFILNEAEEANDPVYGYKTSKPQESTSKPKLSHTSTLVSTTQSSKYVDPPCAACGEKHRLFYCSKFKEMKPTERLELVRSKKLCHNCLLSNHVTADCRKLAVCSVPGCGQKHTKFIHVKFTEPKESSDNGQQSFRIETNNTDVTAGVFVPIVNAIVNDSVQKSVLLDSGSTSMFCSSHLVEVLGLKGKPVRYALSTLNSEQQVKRTQLVDISLTSLDGSEIINLTNVYVTDKIPVNVPKCCVDKWQHLSDLPLSDQVYEVDILIGQDHAEALLPLEVRKGDKAGPFAVRTILGWSLNGPVSTTDVVRKSVISNFVSTNNLDVKLENLWSIENDHVNFDVNPMSSEDKHVVKLWEDSVSIENGHYQLPIPWRPNVVVPNNVFVAMSRLKSIKTSLVKRGLYTRYDNEMNKLVDKGYAEVVPKDKVESEQVWYLPHHGVISDKKPDKLRIVFDCASRYKGESLNDKCYRGPDLVNKLLHVLLRFRQHEYAGMADIESMYHQVKIPVQDRDVLRFLWFNESGQIVHYRMTSHLFGGIWCASSSTFALRRILTDSDVSSQVSNIVQKSFYVDDCLLSGPTRDGTLQAMLDTKEVLAKAGFRLTKFVFSDPSSLYKIPRDDRAKEVKEINPNLTSKALGVRWDVSLDKFYFDVNVPEQSIVTKRMMLSFVSSTYDPLGLVSPIVLGGRLLFQEAVRSKMSWDEPISESLLSRWKSWVSALHYINRLGVPRCVKPSRFNEAALELHHFSDASLNAYGSCSYLRCINSSGEVQVQLLMSRCRVTPLKAITIPRLELQAAVLSAKADNVLRQEFELDMLESYFWTDSEIVLKYLNNESRRFQIFVSNRVSLIHQYSKPSQWHHVMGEENPADLLTRVQDPRSINVDLWSHGPSYLQTYKSQWPIQLISSHLDVADPEVKAKKEPIVCHATQAKQHPIDAMVEHYSSWYRLKRGVAWLLKLKQILLTKVKSQDTNQLSVQDIQNAEFEIVRHVQCTSYHDELQAISDGRSIKKSSKLKDLSPIVNQDTLLCVGGRLCHAPVSSYRKNPVILPHNHRIANLIVRDLHNVTHLGTEWVLSLLRSKYWITRARSVIKQVRHKCVACKKLYDKPCDQKMADLPSERLEPSKPSFSYVGLDCFGPFLVKLGRSEIKRYACLFTCMNTRAVHIEKLDKMDTDSFLNGFRRFVGRRGSPVKVWSDNGTNFVGAQSEIAKSLQQLNQKQIQKFSLQNQIEWVFNPPHASHMGGIWERLIRTVRKVLSALLNPTCRLTDDVLQTMLVEVESIINSRPLTKVIDQATDPEALTPNHLLLLREGPPTPPGIYKLNDMCQKRWRYVQYLADQFWKRWLKEYIPELQRRNKWQNSKVIVKVGDLVLIVDENTPRRLWPLALVESVNVGRDGHVRSVRVKTRTSCLVRPVTKIVMLEEQ